MRGKVLRRKIAPAQTQARPLAPGSLGLIVATSKDASASAATGFGFAGGSWARTGLTEIMARAISQRIVCIMHTPKNKVIYTKAYAAVASVCCSVPRVVPVAIHVVAVRCKQ